MCHFLSYSASILRSGGFFSEHFSALVPQREWSQHCSAGLYVVIVNSAFDIQICLFQNVSMGVGELREPFNLWESSKNKLDTSMTFDTLSGVCSLA